MIRRPPRSTLDRSSAASDVYKRQVYASENERLTSSVYKNIYKKIEGKRPRFGDIINSCLLYTSPSPRDRTRSRMPSSA